MDYGFPNIFCFAGQESDPTTRAYADRIRLRHLPHKAYAFGPSLENLSYPIEDLLPEIADESSYELRKAANTTVEALREGKVLSENSDKIEKAIADEAEAMGIRLSAISTNLSLLNRRPDVFVVGTAHKDKRRHVQIMCQGEQLIAGRKYTNASEQQDAFELLKEIGFVMSDKSWRPAMFFAARDVLSRFPSSPLKVDLKVEKGSHQVTSWPRFLPEYRLSALKSGQSSGELQRFERSLRNTSVFDEKPWLAEPIDPDDPNAREISAKLKPFLGVHGWQVTPRTVAYYLSQFPPRLRAEMGGLLRDQLTLIDWKSISTGLGSLLDDIGVDADLLPLTATSGNTVLETFRREGQPAPGVKHHFHTSLSADALRTKRPLVFLDDNAASGTQAAAQFLSLFGVPRDKWPAQCQNEANLIAPLKSAQIAKLGGRQIYLLLSVGTSDAQEFVANALKTAGVSTRVEIRFAQELKKTSGISAPLKTFLEEVGTSVCAWHLYRKQTSELSAAELANCAANALGYGNAGGMIATLQNVPSGAITALWQPGVFRGHPWMPLLIRNSRFEDLVIG
ncbi:hypothetical protein [Devosia sp.]|uniref:phosphoribosyltransferase-like protein n=1 Tax=Devosia sp. TaxID=1871048 RepID=UPI001AD4339B|nr:hypothetical protein [Devosia sp.]MBN9333201.1 hypothetical protein [Devosia sp.]